MPKSVQDLEGGCEVVGDAHYAFMKGIYIHEGILIANKRT